MKNEPHDWFDGEAYLVFGRVGCGEIHVVLNIISGCCTQSGRILVQRAVIGTTPRQGANIAQVPFRVVYDTILYCAPTIGVPACATVGRMAYVVRRGQQIAGLIGHGRLLNRKAAGDADCQTDPCQGG